MRRFYALVRLSYGEPASPAKAAALEVDWWRVHRQARYPSAPRGSGDELVESVTRLYCYLYGEPEAQIRPAAMTGPGRWTCPTGGLRKAACPTARFSRRSTQRSYGARALLAAVHH